ncbi:MAG: hypothetical protein M3R38_16850 [Actinomycetota bacterium]|nr:hypothetical protein [Actinomycetota bacterium]
MANRAGLVGPEEIAAYIERQENRIALMYGVVRTAQAVSFVASVEADIDRL